MSRFIITLFLGVFLLSCSNDDIVVLSADAEIQAWLDTMGISASRDDDTGIYYYEVVDNPSGNQAVSGAVAAVYYTLRDPDGNIIAQHLRSDGDSLIFKIGASAVYPLGLDFGVSLMRVGEIYNFIFPPSQAYTDLTSGDIDSRLIAHFQVQLVGVHNETDLFIQENVAIQDYIDDNYLDSLQINPLDSTELFPATGIVYKRRAAGSGSMPLNGDTIVVDYSGRFIDDSNFGSASGFQWNFGSGEPRELLPGFEFGVSLMQTGEDALIMIPSSQGYRESALVVPGFIIDGLIEDGIVPDYVSLIPPYSTLLFEITRID
ncbi:FKBP-type peptidyl-prolyl cis-trans isomerase [Ekhidna sp.]|uniref:FKBP-type peptidyl-prolyl cis-trans isomerase n=1 Tax=Ekhidna sp. TaxID=2608089 RepID=UPI0032EE02A2